ncbi:MAG TPA: ribonuclease J [Actinomycetota bacterium]|nr:ribonuclease J [Actinomycetota bacterium]
MSARCRLVFLGGVGEVGRNMACLELGDDVLVLDAGLSFPTEDMPGIDLVLPDFQYLRDRQDRIAGVVITHGHEDHQGALPYILRDIPLHVYATPLALGLLRPKLEEHDVVDRATLHEIHPGEEGKIGPFTVRTIRVTHSIPEGMALAVDTPYGTLLHSGDFRLDPTPIDGLATDLQSFAEEARRGVHLFLSDSTNAEDEGTIPSERTVGPELLRIFSGAGRLVVAACFASHIHRIQQVANAALAVGRKVAVLGRSMQHAVAQAREFGHLDLPDDAVLDIEEAMALPPERVAVVCTGSQGEPLSALSLMAAHEHKWVKLQDGDTVVIAASLIPGNEVAIHRTIDGLYRTGADVFHTGISHVHVSGHAAAEELKFMLGLVRPEWFIPIHGERRHLSHHARLAREVGIPDDRILICEDGDVVDIAEKVEVVERVDAGMVLVDGLGIGDVGEVVLRDRRKLAGDGVVIVVLTAEAHSGEVLAGPDIITRGFVHDETSAEMLEEARRRTVASLAEVAAEEVGDPSILKQHVRRTLGRYFFEVTKRKPIILPVIMEV